MESPLSFFRMHWDHEPDWHPSPCPLPAKRGEGGRRPERGGSWKAQLTDHLPHCLLVNLKGAFAKTDKQYLLNRALPFEKRFDFCHSNPRRAFHRKTVRAGADGWKRNRLHAVLFSQSE